MPSYDTWLVAQWKGTILEIQGVYNDEALAVASCQSDQWVVCPMVMNESLSPDTLPEQGYFPLARQA